MSRNQQKVWFLWCMASNIWIVRSEAACPSPILDESESKCNLQFVENKNGVILCEDDQDCPWNEQWISDMFGNLQERSERFVSINLTLGYCGEPSTSHKDIRGYTTETYRQSTTQTSWRNTKRYTTERSRQNTKRYTTETNRQNTRRQYEGGSYRYKRSKNYEEKRICRFRSELGKLLSWCVDKTNNLRIVDFSKRVEFVCESDNDCEPHGYMRTNTHFSQQFRESINYKCERNRCISRNEKYWRKIYYQNECYQFRIRTGNGDIGMDKIPACNSNNLCDNRTISLGVSPKIASPFSGLGLLNCGQSSPCPGFSSLPCLQSHCNRGGLCWCPENGFSCEGPIWCVTRAGQCCPIVSEGNNRLICPNFC